MISDFVADQYITLTANPEYTGDNTPNIEEITVRFIPDPLAAVQALENGEVDIISPQSTADIKTAARRARRRDGHHRFRGHVRAPRPAVRERQEPREHLLEPARSVRRSSRRFRVRRSSTSSSCRSPARTRICATRRSSCPGAEGYDESVANNGSDAYAERRHRGRQGAARRSPASPTRRSASSTRPTTRVASTSSRSSRRRPTRPASTSQTAVPTSGVACWARPVRTTRRFFGWQSTSLGVTNSLPTFQTGGINNLNFYSNADADAIVEQLNVEFDPDKQIAAPAASSTRSCGATSTVSPSSSSRTSPPSAIAWRVSTRRSSPHDLLERVGLGSNGQRRLGEADRCSGLTRASARMTGAGCRSFRGLHPARYTSRSGGACGRSMAPARPVPADSPIGRRPHHGFIHLPAADRVDLRALRRNVPDVHPHRFRGRSSRRAAQGNAPNKLELIEARTKLLNLDVPPPLRYFLWLGGIFRGDFGVSVQNQPVNILLANAITSTLTLVTTATVVAIILGLTVGIISALRQYSGFDYSVTLVSLPRSSRCRSSGWPCCSSNTARSV